MDTLTSIQARNIRSLADVRLELRGLTVLVGRNGSGKSTLIEVCRLLKRLPSTEFAPDLYALHGGPRALARDPGRPIEFGATFDGVGLWAGLEQVGSNSRFQAELVTCGDGVVLSRLGNEVTDSGGRGDLPAAESNRSILVQALPLVDPPLAARVAATLEAIDVHLQLDTLARWGARSVGRHREGMREPQTLGNTRRMHLLAHNLPNVYYALRNELGDDHWRETMELIRLGLGLEVREVLTPNYGPGEVGLTMRFRGTDADVPAAQLSDGMLAWLVFVAMVRLPHLGGLLAIDEPELHFEPRLLARVVDLLEEHARSRPVLVATHSDRFLDALEDPADSVVTCELDESRATVLLRPDRDALARWMEDFSGYGALRAAGHEAAVLTRAGG